MPNSIAPSEVVLNTPLQDVRGFTPTRVEALRLLGLTTVADLVRHLPMRHERLEAESTIDQLQPGTIGSARGEITATRLVPSGKSPRFEAVVMDHTGRVDLVWFNGTYLKSKLFPGLQVRVQGMVKSRGPGVQIANPKFEILSATAPLADAGESASMLRPVYPASESINSAQIQALVEKILDRACSLIPDHLPEAYRAERSLPPLAQAYRMVHAPEGQEDIGEAMRRLAFDELLLLQLGVFLRREQLRQSVRAIVLPRTSTIDAAIRNRFGFALTNAQGRTIDDICADLAGDHPASRLIQGDVGSGKTVVALYAMLLAVAHKHQAAIMAPTEILAEQHFLSISRMLQGSSVRVELLTGALPAGDKADVLARLASGAIDVLVGTHALLTDRVRFHSLAVAVIDEQHRFGVHQRASLKSKGADAAEPTQQSTALLLPVARTDTPSGAKVPDAPADQRPLAPHMIVMTATPIPRTLALTLLGDLDVSVIDELPPGRTPIATRVVAPAAGPEVYRYVRTRLDAGDQAYIVVPAIDTGMSAGNAAQDGELTDLRSLVARLEGGELQGKRIAALHGRLARDTREAIMARFRAGAIDCLVATTVIEVGVDVPNATIMVVEHAERFGLAQLHQLRGRVGRGAKRSVCILIGDPVTPDADARLRVMADTTDGFVLAEKDLEIRGPGEVFGLKQAGAPPFRVADLMRDRDLLALARRDAQQWIARSPNLDAPDELALRKRLLRAHGQWLGLADVG